MFAYRFRPTLLLLSLLSVSISSGLSGRDFDIYLFNDGDGGYHPGIVSHKIDRRWFFSEGGESPDREKDIHFLLYTRGYNSFKPQELIVGHVDQLKKSSFNATIPTKIIIHGFTNSDKIGFPPASRRTFLENNNSPLVNLIVVDWGKLAQAPWYTEAAQNTQLVGVKVARFIEFLVAQGSSLDQIHLIGHSLGSHIAGVAGSNLNNMTLSRITALDPALPLFEDANNKNRIDPSDAAFVDVIHTAGGESRRIIRKGVIMEETKALAFIEPMGHADFFVNGGRQQPGCGMDFFGACSYLRAYEYYLESVLNPHGFPSCECKSWEAYGDGSCDCSTVAYLGEQCSFSSKGNFFLRTRSKQPYAVADSRS